MDLELEIRNDVHLPAQGVYGMAADNKNGKIVVVRKIDADSDAVVVQYSTLPEWCILPEKVHSLRNGPIESVCFVGEHIVSTHLNGSITIMHPHKPEFKIIQVSPSPLWACTPLDQSRIAMVSHSAQLITFDVTAGHMIHVKNMGVDTRLFSVASHGNQIAVGATGTIFLMTNEGDPKELKLERSDKQLPTIVWCLTFAENGRVLASGDSRGHLSLWNTKDGSLITQLLTHQADILSICVADDGVIAAAGVDPRIVKVQEKGRKWGVVLTNNGPKSDVRGLVRYNRQLLAGGADGRLSAGRLGKFHSVVENHGRFIMVGGNITVVQGTNYVDIYTVGRIRDKKNMDSDDIFRMSEDPVYFCRINSHSKQYITASALSPDGRYLCISTGENTLSYVINPSNKKQPIRKTNLLAPASTAIAVTNYHLFIPVDDFRLLRFPLEGGEGTEVVEQFGCGEIIQICASPSGKFVGVMTTRAELFLINTHNGISRKVKKDRPLSICLPTDDHLYVLVSGGIHYRRGEEYENGPLKPLLFKIATNDLRDQYWLYNHLFDNALLPFDYPLSIDCDQTTGTLSIMRADGKFVVMDKNDGLYSFQSEIKGLYHGTVDDYVFSIGWRKNNGMSITRNDPFLPTTEPFKLKQYGQN